MISLKPQEGKVIKGKTFRGLSIMCTNYVLKKVTGKVIPSNELSFGSKKSLDLVNAEREKTIIVVNSVA